MIYPYGSLLSPFGIRGGLMRKWAVMVGSQTTATRLCSEWRDPVGSIDPSWGAPQAFRASVAVAGESFFATSILSLRSRRARETRLLIVPT